jgi:DNA-binding transcriptional MerR regulator
MIDTTPRLRIGELAAELGLNPKTIRYYESIDLLPPPRRTAARYRLYGEADRQRLRFIRKARAIGLSLEEIRRILVIRQQGEQPCAHVLDLLDRKLASVEQQLRALEDFRDELVSLRGEAAERLTDDGCVCGIIEHHAAGAHSDLLPITVRRSPRPQQR